MARGGQCRTRDLYRLYGTEDLTEEGADCAIGAALDLLQAFKAGCGAVCDKGSGDQGY